MPSLLACKCTSDICTCSDPFQTGELDALAAKQHKDSSVNDLTKISDLLANLDPKQREKVITELPPNTRKILIDELTAAASKSTRLDHMLAEANRRKNLIAERVNNELERLGVAKPMREVQAARQKYRVSELDALMKAKNWNPDRRMAFKSDLARLGLLD